MQEDVLQNNARVTRVGCAPATGYDGGAALFLNNPAQQSATDFARIQDSGLGTDNFTLRFWIKADRGACHGWCLGEEFLPIADTLDPAAATPAQRAHNSVLVSNTVFDSIESTGLVIAHPQPRAFLTVHFCPVGAQAVQFTGLRDTYDGRWHAVALSCDREGRLLLFIDQRLRGEADISALAGLSLGDAPLCVGADARGENGFGPGWIQGFTLQKRALSAEEIIDAYYTDALRLLSYEIAQRGLDKSPLYDAAQAREFLQQAHSLAQITPAQAAYEQLKTAYEAFLLRTKTPDLKLVLVSDVHCDGDEGGRTQALRKGLTWANKLGVQALVDGGDYSNFGKDFELDSYWNALRDLWQDKPVFVTVGNHETLELKCHELVRYQVEHLHEKGMVASTHNKFYYDGEVNGYHFIVLAQYSDTYTVTGYKRMWRYAGEIKQEQIDFAREKLDQYCNQGKPVFLVIHNSMRALLDEQTEGKFLDDSVIIAGDALYDVLRGHPDAVICTGHVHHGFGGGAGFHKMADNYNVIDANGFRGGVIGYCIGDRDVVGTRHGAYFIDVFGKTLLLRAVDFATGEWLTAYDQTVTL